MATQRLKRRVVVTGIGAVTPLGLTFTDSWAALLQNRSGAVTLREALLCQNLADDRLEQELVTAQALPCQVAAPVQNFVSSDARTSRFVQLALAAATEAVSSAGLTDWWANNNSTAPEAIQRQQRAGVSIGSGMSGVREIADAVRMMDTLGYRKLSPHFVPKVLGNSAAARVSLLYGLRGSNWTASTACAAGSHAIGDAARCIETGQADIMLAGGAESCIDPLSLAGFCRLRALSTAFNEDPAAASRPFDVNRDGFVMGEGACVLVLEELEHAMERLSSSKGAAFVELIGYGATGDAHHITSPDPDGRGAVEAMQMAVNEAGIDAASIQYVNAHATSTPKGDEIEARAIHHAVCGGATREHSVFVSSTKGATGHLLGAAGAIEAAFTVQALLDQQIPPTRNLVQVESEISQLQGLTCVRGDAMKKYTSNEFDVAMSNSFGFGGTNASLIFRRIRVSDC